MRRLTLLLATAAIGLTAGCEREERTARQELATTAQEDPGYATDTAAAVVAVPDTAGGQTLTGNLAEMGNSGASGVVTLTPRNGQTLMQLSVTGVQPGMRLLPTVFRGGCQEPGQEVHRLQALEVGQPGAALENVVVPVPVQSIADGTHSVRIYPEAGYPQTPALACAEIPTTAAPTRM
jgi:hypothetical protein